MASEIDDKHIFSEFLDPVRHKLIAEFVELAGDLALVPRTSLFALWFSDINVLRTAVKPSEHAFRTALGCIIKNPAPDHAGICKLTKKTTFYKS